MKVPKISHTGDRMLDFLNYNSDEGSEEEVDVEPPAKKSKVVLAEQKSNSKNSKSKSKT